MTSCLELDGFGLAFGERTILRSVGFCLAARGCTVLLGPAGTGKSALLRTLAGFNDAHPALHTWGSARYGGAPLDDGPRPALIMQRAQLLVATVLENLVSELPNRNRMTRAAQIEHLRTVLTRLDQTWLLGRLTDKVIDCRAHEQRLIAILRSALAQPHALMVDEPTSGLDAEHAAPLLALIGRLARERALLVVLHHLGQTRAIADRVMLLADGLIQECQDVERFFAAPRSAAARAFLRTGSCPEALAHVGRIEPGWVQSKSRIRFAEQFAQVVANPVDSNQTERNCLP